MTALIRTLQEKLHDIREANNYKMYPFIYLGHTEYEEMESFAKLYCVIEDDKYKDNDRPRFEYQGCPVLEVNLESHIGIGL